MLETILSAIDGYVYLVTFGNIYEDTQMERTRVTLQFCDQLVL